MSWVPPYLAQPNCSQCINRHFAKLYLDGVPFDYVYCALRDERRYFFRKNPPRHDSSDNGANCKRYCPPQAASHPQADDWVEFPSRKTK